MAEELGVTNETAFAPEKSKEAEKPGRQESFEPKLNNLAGDAELAKQAWVFAQQSLNHFKDQPARTKFFESSGVADKADRMWRMAAERRDTSSTQYQKTDSEITSSLFYNLARGLSSIWATIFFSNRTLPAKFTPDINTDEYDLKDGKDIADQQNMYEMHIFDEDKREPKVRETLDFLAKYGQEMVGIDWVTTTEKRVERVVSARDNKGVPTAFAKKEVPRVVFAGPQYRRWDLKDCYFDAQIDDMQKQNCIVLLDQIQRHELLQEQQRGWLMNVGKIRSRHYYTQEPDDNSTLESRKENAGESTTIDATGLVRRVTVWMRVPIKESKRKGRGKWSPEDTEPEIYWATFAGDITQGKPEKGKEDSGVVCLRLVKNPYSHKQIPLKLLHSHRDDKGAYHVCLAQQIDPHFQEDVTNINLAIDNVRKRTNTPYYAEGPIHKRNLTFRYGGNMVIQGERGTKLQPLAVAPATEITMAMREAVRKEAQETAGMNKPMLPEALGQRTSATEAMQVRDQSLVPLDCQADYIANQLFPWMFDIDAADIRQYADPKRIISVTHNNMIVPVQPANLWGPVKIKVTCIDTYRNDVRARQEINALMQGLWPIARQDATPEGRALIYRWVFGKFGFPNSEDVWPVKGDYDARRVALEENEKLLRGEYDAPQPGENQTTHIAVHLQAEREYELLPVEQQNEVSLQALKTHRVAHEALQQQGEAGLGMAGMTPKPEQGTPAELAMNPVEGQMGAMK